MRDVSCVLLLEFIRQEHRRQNGKKEMKEIDVTEVEEVTNENARRLFGIK